LPFERLLSGSANELGERLSELRELGVDDVIVRCASPDQATAITTLQELGR